MMVLTEHHFCAVCGDEAFVGVGDPVRWLCLTHFNEHLAEVRRLIDETLAKLNPLRGVDTRLST